MPNEHETDAAFLENFFEHNPESVVFARLADSYLKMDKVDIATELCEDGIKKHPYYATGHFILGKCYLAKKKYELAEKEFKRVLLFDPKFLAAHKYYGDLMKEIGWENTCETSYKKILQIDPLDEVARSMAGEHILEGTEIETEEHESTTEDHVDSFESQLAETKVGADIMEPMPISPEEEDILFQGGEEDEVKKDTEDKTSAIEGRVTQIDDEKAEEFSYILDDIFKDEVVEEEKEDSTMSLDDASSEDEAIVEFEDDPESYLAQLRIEEEETPKPENEPNLELDEFKSSGFSPEIQSDAGDSFQEFESPDFREESLHKPSFKEPEPVEKAPAPRPNKYRKAGGDKIVTPTLGEIYAAQGQYSKAIDVFENLLKKHPENDFYLKKIDHLKQKLAEAKDVS